MSLLKDLQTASIRLPGNIKFTDGVPVTLQVDCPQTYCQAAREHGGDKTPLKIECHPPGYAGWSCRNCLWSGHIGEAPEEQPAEKAEKAITRGHTKLPEEAIDFLQRNCITAEEAEQFKLGWDAQRKSIKIPFLESGQVINATLLRIEDGKSRLASSKRIVFWGLDLLDANEKSVVIAHRELDAMILLARGFKNVIAIPNGGDFKQTADEFDTHPDKLAYLASAAELIKSWQSVKFCLDDTEDGLAIRQELARRIGPGKCSTVTPSRTTIAATMLELGSEGVCADMAEARPLPIFGLYELNDFEKELVRYFEHGMGEGVTTGWPNVDKLYTVVPGQLTVVTGIPNSGKSEWVDALSLNLAMKFGWRFAAFSPENGKEAHATKLIEKRVEMSADPKSKQRMSFDTFMNGAEWVQNHYSFIENTETMPTLDWILERAADAALRYGIKGLIIDPWNRIEKKLAQGQNETDYVGSSIPRILRLAVNYGLHVWLVVHPKQQQPDHKTGKIRAPSLYDMAGSAHFVNMCDNGVVIHRSESVDDATEVHVKKVRFKHVGRRGETKLKYNRNTGRYSPLEEQFTEEQFRAVKEGEEPAGIRTYDPED